jgi:ubiquinone/menaquinone biosynthesis C-methylase UbiE
MRSPADVYDERSCRRYSAWGPVLCDAARDRSGQRVLDVGCGTAH